MVTKQKLFHLLDSYSRLVLFLTCLTILFLWTTFSFLDFDLIIINVYSEAYSEPNQTCKIKHFAKIVSGFQLFSSRYVILFKSEKKNTFHNLADRSQSRYNSQTYLEHNSPQSYISWILMTQYENIRLTAEHVSFVYIFLHSHLTVMIWNFFWMSSLLPYFLNNAADAS